MLTEVELSKIMLIQMMVIINYNKFIITIITEIKVWSCLSQSKSTMNETPHKAYFIQLPYTQIHFHIVSNLLSNMLNSQFIMSGESGPVKIIFECLNTDTEYWIWLNKLGNNYNNNNAVITWKATQTMGSRMMPLWIWPLTFCIQFLVTQWTST